MNGYLIDVVLGGWFRLNHVGNRSTGFLRRRDTGLVLVFLILLTSSMMNSMEPQRKLVMVTLRELFVLRSERQRVHELFRLFV